MVLSGLQDLEHKLRLRRLLYGFLGSGSLIERTIHLYSTNE